MKRAIVNQPPVPAVGTIGGIGGTNPIGSGDEWGPNPVDFALDDLSDVDTTGVTDGQVIVYDAGTMTWIPGGASAASIWVPVMTETSTDRWELATIAGSPPDPLYADGDFLYISVADTPLWLVTATGDGDAVMAEVFP